MSTVKHRIGPRLTLYLRPSRIAGVGVFTTVPLKVGMRPRLFSRGDERPRPKGLRGKAATYPTDTTAPKDFHRMSVGWYLNDSKSPNVDARSMTVIRYIPAGTELTIDYDMLADE